MHYGTQHIIMCIYLTKLCGYKLEVYVVFIFLEFPIYKQGYENYVNVCIIQVQISNMSSCSVWVPNQTDKTY